jgi:hypothetical protein
LRKEGRKSDALEPLHSPQGSRGARRSFVRLAVSLKGAPGQLRSSDRREREESGEATEWEKGCAATRISLSSIRNRDIGTSGEQVHGVRVFSVIWCIAAMRGAEILDAEGNVAGSGTGQSLTSAMRCTAENQNDRQFSGENAANAAWKFQQTLLECNLCLNLCTSVAI